jgi:type II secretory ATPase GspE/PulE/Tfp pilus assembly ATPase PilB-like protein
VTLEDPVEVLVEGVSQSQTQLAAGLDFPTGLRSLLRQDPEVLFIGEIRDRITAEVALEASLTGHLVISSFHAGSAAGAISRLFDMGIEPYAIQSGVRAIVCQRLVRALCRCARPADERGRAGLPVEGARMAVGCADCEHTGHRGRRLIAEMLPLGSPELRAAILARADLAALQRAAVADGLSDLRSQAYALVSSGAAAPAEVRRVLGVAAEA